MIITAAERMSHRGGHFLASQQELIKNLRKNGKHIIDLGRGNPDQATFYPIVEHFLEDTKTPSNFGYPPYGGKTSLKVAIREFYKQEYGVELLLDEITVFSGSLAALTALPMVLSNPGDGVLVPDPAFFGYEAGVRMSGAQAIKMPLTVENAYLPDFEKLDTETLAKTKLMFLNYPHNPTGAGATQEFFDKVVDFAEQNNIAVVHDFAYADISFNGPSPSFLQSKGAKSVGIEIYTLSKTFNMAGWRIAFAVGSQEIIKLLEQYIRSSVGGTFGAIQDAASYALSHTTDARNNLRKLYEKRRGLVLSLLKKYNIAVIPSNGTFFLWVRLPLGWNDVEFADELLRRAGLAVVPGTVFGATGRGHIRISLVSDEEELRNGIEQLGCFMTKKREEENSHARS